MDASTPPPMRPAPFFVTNFLLLQASLTRMLQLSLENERKLQLEASLDTDLLRMNAKRAPARPRWFVETVSRTAASSACAGRLLRINQTRCQVLLSDPGLLAIWPALSPRQLLDAMRRSPECRPFVPGLAPKSPLAEMTMGLAFGRSSHQLAARPTWLDPKSTLSVSTVTSMSRIVEQWRAAHQNVNIAPRQVDFPDSLAVAGKERTTAVLGEATRALADANRLNPARWSSLPALTRQTLAHALLLARADELSHAMERSIAGMEAW